ncbi:MAG: chorismate synthase [Myxococcota bacterium]|nr:chorismate synthase [Myxococcota bacterium]
MSSIFGRFFCVSTFGESHGQAMGCVIDGCPPGINISTELIAKDLQRRRPGQSRLTSNRKETDEFQILSGVFEGKTLGTPISILIPNSDARSKDYRPFKNVYRPSHADFTYDAKYGHRDWRGGGRASARETVARVAAGAIAKQVLKQLHQIQILAWVDSVGPFNAEIDPTTITHESIESSMVRCPSPDDSQKFIEHIELVRRKKDSTGGIIRGYCTGIPAGLGSPVFDKMEAELAKAMLSIPAAKGFEIGSGFSGTRRLGSEHNDQFVKDGSVIKTLSNHSGGIQGGISNGMPIDFRVAFKPVATIFKSQTTVDSSGNETNIAPKGRHDPCVVPRAVPIVEAGAALVLCDQLLAQNAIDWSH